MTEPIDWAAWQAQNARLVSEGWMLHTDLMEDGTILEYASKDGVTIDRSPDLTARKPSGG